MMMIKKLNENDSNALNKVIQYCAKSQILELLKQTLDELEYYRFIKDVSNTFKAKDNEESTDKNKILSAEDSIEYNISKEHLFDFIKKYDINIYNNIIDELITYIY